MATPPQLTQIAFAGGIDQSQRPEVLDPSAAFVGAENVRQQARGGWSKRHGFAALGVARFDGTSRTAGYKVFADADVIAVSDGSLLDVYDTVSGKWKSAFRACEVGYRAADLPSLGFQAYVGDVETCAGYVAMSAISDSAQAYVALLDRASLATVAGPSFLVSPADAPLIASYGGRYFIAVVPQPGSNGINAWCLDTAAIGAGWTFIGALTLAWSWGVISGNKVAVCSLSDRIGVAFTTGAGTDRVTVITVDKTGILDTATVPTSSTSPDCIDLNGSSADTLWVAWNEGVSVKMKGLTATSLSTVKATTGTIITTASATGFLKIALSATAGKGRLAAAGTGASPSATAMRGFQTTTGAAATDGSQITVQHAVAIGKPLTFNGRYYMMFLPDLTGTARSAVLCDWTEDVTHLRPVCHPAPSQVVFGTINGKIVAGSSSSKFLLGLTVTRSAVATSAELLEFDFGDTRRWQPVRHGRSVYLTGGMTSYFDGIRSNEVGFVTAPPTPAAVLSGTGVTRTNGRCYVAVYEDVDGDGNWIVSGISNPSTITGAVANKTITVSTSPLTISTRCFGYVPGADGPTLRVVFYATLDSAIGQPPYYRLTDTRNDTSTTTNSITDTVDDATLATHAKLYAPDLPGTVGESLDRRAPPGLMHLESYNGMLVGSEGNNLFWSGQPVDGEATWFSPLFQQPFPGCTGLKAQDGTLYCFKRREVWTSVGEAPADNGASGGLELPRKLAVDVGCIDPRSLVVTAKGIFFQSERGIEILTRAQDVQWIGEGVRDTTDAFPVCTQATLDAIAGRVYFEMSTTETANQVSGGGRTLVFNLTLGTWESIDRRKNSAGTADAPAQSAAIVYTGSAYRYAWLGADGVVYVEDRTTYLDPGSAWVRKYGKTAHFKGGGIQGYQMVNRALLMAKWATAHDMNVTCAYDYSATPKAAQTKTAPDIATLVADWPNEQLEYCMHDEAECMAVQFEIYDAAPTSGTVGTGEGATWVALTLEGATRSGAVRLPNESR